MHAYCLRPGWAASSWTRLAVAPLGRPFVRLASRLAVPDRVSLISLLGLLLFTEHKHSSFTHFVAAVFTLLHSAALIRPLLSSLCRSTAQRSISPLPCLPAKQNIILHSCSPWGSFWPSAPAFVTARMYCV